MSYNRTAKFKAHNPSGHKRRVFRADQKDFSRAYAENMNALARHEEELRQSWGADDPDEELRDKVKQYADLDLRSELKAGVKKEIVSGLQSYFELDDGDHQNASFPAPRPKRGGDVEAIIDELLHTIPCAEREDDLKHDLRREETPYRRPIEFVRHRDAPLLRSDDGEKLWAAPKIKNRGKDTYFPANPIKDCRLLKSRDRYTLYPLSCGRWHMHRFFRTGEPKSCRVVARGNDLYFHYSFKFDRPRRPDPNAVIGVDRGRAITAAYTAINRNGALLEKGASFKENMRERLQEIDQAISRAQSKGRRDLMEELYEKRANLVEHSIHRIANNIVEMADRYNAQITFEDLDNIKGATGNSNLDRGLKRSQYSRLTQYLEYKAEEKGLRDPKYVWPSHTSTTCPCGYQGDEDEVRPTRDRFVCPECGHEAHADLNAGRMIALRGLKIINGVSGSFTEFIKQLDRNQ